MLGSEASASAIVASVACDDNSVTGAFSSPTVSSPWCSLILIPSDDMASCRLSLSTSTSILASVSGGTVSPVASSSAAGSSSCVSDDPFSAPASWGSWGPAFCIVPLLKVKYPGQLHFRTSMLAPIATNAWPVAPIAPRVAFMLLAKMSVPCLGNVGDGSPDEAAGGGVIIRRRERT